jgi:hypothetical protein
MQRLLILSDAHVRLLLGLHATYTPSAPETGTIYSRRPGQQIGKDEDQQEEERDVHGPDC